jgi:hypothetical protein
MAAACIALHAAAQSRADDPWIASPTAFRDSAVVPVAYYQNAAPCYRGYPQPCPSCQPNQGQPYSNQQQWEPYPPMPLTETVPAPSPDQQYGPQPGDRLQQPDNGQQNNTPQANQNAFNQQNYNQSSSLGAARGAQSSVPSMMGDSFGGSFMRCQGFATFNTGSSLASTSSTIVCPSIYTGGVVGQARLSENVSPIPRDRVFMNYSYFDQVPLTSPRININRWSPGFEKTFFNRMASIEIRTPFAGTINNNINNDTPQYDTQFGNLFITLKGLIAQSSTCAISTGMSVTCPTANNVSLTNERISPTVTLNNVTFQNGIVRVQPFAAIVLTPNDRLFMQGMVQVDVECNSSPVTATFSDAPNQTQSVSLHDQTYIYADLALGYWMYRSNNPHRLVTAVSPIIEAHYAQSLSPQGQYTFVDPNQVMIPSVGTTMSTFTVGNAAQQFQLLNTTIGANFQLGPMSSLLVGYSTPIGSGLDQQFNGEFRMIFNRRFGPQNRATRAQF